MRRKERIAKKKKELIKTTAGSCKLLTNFLGKAPLNYRALQILQTKRQGINLFSEFHLEHVLFLTSHSTDLF